MATPSIAMMDFLATQGLALTKGANLFAGPIREVSTLIPNQCIFVNNSAGAEPQRVMGDSASFRTVIVDIRVRWDKFGTGETKARAILDAIQGASISGYLDVTPMTSDPSPVQRDMNDLFIWQVLASMMHNKTI